MIPVKIHFVICGFGPYKVAILFVSFIRFLLAVFMTFSLCSFQESLFSIVTPSYLKESEYCICFPSMYK